MKHFLFLAAILLTSHAVDAQAKKYKEYQVCTAKEVYKGKVNHGKSYCVSWATVRVYNNGKKDTVGWTFAGGKSFVGDGYQKYEKLSERGKYIVDSLEEDLIPELSHSYLAYEPIFMKTGSKQEYFYSIEGDEIVMYKYILWNKKNSEGVELLKRYNVK